MRDKRGIWQAVCIRLCHWGEAIFSKGKTREETRLFNREYLRRIYMFRWKKGQDLREQAEQYASHYDFREIFTEDEAGLRLLAVLLTGDRESAEKCLVAGLEEGSAGNPAFHNWAHSWSKRAIIKNAIQAVSPSPHQANGNDQYAFNDSPDTLAGAVSILNPFERFVFVMSLVEGY